MRTLTPPNPDTFTEDPKDPKTLMIEKDKETRVDRFELGIKIQYCFSVGILLSLGFVVELLISILFQRNYGASNILWRWGIPIPTHISTPTPRVWATIDTLKDNVVYSQVGTNTTPAASPIWGLVKKQ